MRITIEFCMMWNYAPRAVSLADRLLDEHRQDISELTLKPSSGGVFEVTVNNGLVFSKKSLNRHAQPDEIEQAIREFRLKA